MSINRREFHTILTAAALGTAAPLHGDQGTEVSPRRPVEHPVRGDTWWGVVTRTDLDVYADPTAEEPLEPDSYEPLTFGELVNVVEVSTDLERRMLVARWMRDPNNGRQKFVGMVGWVDAQWILDRHRAVYVDEAVTALDALITEDDDRRERLRLLLPSNSLTEYRNRNVWLKVVTDPDRGSHCFRQPIPPEEHVKRANEWEGTEDVIPLQGFGFYYVANVVVRGAKSIYLLLADRSRFRLTNTRAGSVRSALLGWVEIGLVRPWTTRQAFEFHLEDDLSADRLASGEPIQLFSHREHLEDWARRKADGRPESLPEAKHPVWTERPDDALIACGPWPPRWMRYLIMDRYSVTSETDGYELCVLGGRGQSDLIASRADLERHRDRVRDIVRTFTVFQLILVLDATASMEAAIRSLKGALKDVVAMLKDEERRQESLLQIDLRVGVVAYRDKHCEPAKLVEASPGYFHVMSEHGQRGFDRFIDGLTCVYSYDQVEEPYEGLKAAHEGFWKVNSRHTNGAETLALIIGNGAQRESDYADFEAASRGVLDLFGPVEAHDGKKGARVTLHSLFVAPTAAHPTLGKEQWDTQMQYLTENTGGTTGQMNFFKQSDREARATLASRIREGVDHARTMLELQLQRLIGTYLPAEDTAPAASGDPDVRQTLPELLLTQRLQEVVSAEDWNRIQEGIASQFFATVHAVDRLPGETQPRLLPSVVLTESEIRDLYYACDALATAFDNAIADADWDEVAPDEQQDVYKKLLVRALVASMGTGEQDIRDLLDLPLAEIEDRISLLPVRFGCLEQRTRDSAERPGPENFNMPPVDDADVIALIERLNLAAAQLRTIVNSQHIARRWGAQVGGLSEPHFWVYEHELP